MVGNMMRALTHLLDKHPIVGPILSAGILTCLGDLIAQHWVEKRSWGRHDWRRSLRQTSYGLFIVGPATCLWYRLLDARVKYENTAITTIVRVALDQLVFAPLFLGVYFAYNSILEGSSLRETREKIRSKYMSALMANYKLWPAVQLINFYMIPLNYRLVFVNVVALGWNAYLSNLHSKGIAKGID